MQSCRRGPYRPKRTAHGAVQRVAEAIVQQKTRVLDFDLRSYFDNVRHDRLLEKVAQRVDDADIMHLLKGMLKASGNKGVPQGGVITPRTQKITFDLSARLLSGVPVTFLICVAKGNIYYVI